MDDQQTKQEILNWLGNPPKGIHSHFSWPTDCCGYDQHIKFVDAWRKSNEKDFKKFSREYAESL